MPFYVVTHNLYYFQGLVQSKQTIPLHSSSDLALTQEPAITSTAMEQKNENTLKADEESCPICQEKLSNQKMVFQCGHITCCKCESPAHNKKQSIDVLVRDIKASLQSQILYFYVFSNSVRLLCFLKFCTNFIFSCTDKSMIQLIKSLRFE